MWNSGANVRLIFEMAKKRFYLPPFGAAGLGIAQRHQLAQAKSDAVQREGQVYR
jgi:hypothetical protein